MLENHTNLAASLRRTRILTAWSVAPANKNQHTTLGWALQQVYTTYNRTLTPHLRHR